MITFDIALAHVLKTITNFGTENVPLENAVGRVLATDVYTDRPLPPFDRVTKDGIAVAFDTLNDGKNTLPIAAVIAAGDPVFQFSKEDTCVEIMTGAVLPIGADTVIMYEETVIENGKVTFTKPAQKGINVHTKGSDRVGNSLVLKANQFITGKEIGVLASVGIANVRVKKVPSVAIIATGNELIAVDQQPLPHQIRTSNSYSLLGALAQFGIKPEMYHLNDSKEVLYKQLKTLVATKDVLLLSGGVSKGKFDYVPEVLAQLEVTKLFHRVAQQPGKPLWFGVQNEQKTVVFSFPGNPASTYVNFHVYFVAWLYASWQLFLPKEMIKLKKPMEGHELLTRYLLVTIENNLGTLEASLVGNNGSGDFVNLATADGVVVIPPQTTSNDNTVVQYIQF